MMVLPLGVAPYTSLVALNTFHCGPVTLYAVHCGAVSGTPDVSTALSPGKDAIVRPESAAPRAMVAVRRYTPPRSSTVAGFTAAPRATPTA